MCSSDLDEFIARIETTLSGDARPGHAITAADVQAATFNVTRPGGYEELTLDEVLDRYAHELDKLTPFPQPQPPATDTDPAFPPSVFPRSAQSASHQPRGQRPAAASPPLTTGELQAHHPAPAPLPELLVPMFHRGPLPSRMP